MTASDNQARRLMAHGLNANILDSVSTISNAETRTILSRISQYIRDETGEPTPTDQEIGNIITAMLLAMNNYGCSSRTQINITRDFTVGGNVHLLNIEDLCRCILPSRRIDFVIKFCDYTYQKAVAGGFVYYIGRSANIVTPGVGCDSYFYTADFLTSTANRSIWLNRYQPLALSNRSSFLYDNDDVGEYGESLGKVFYI